MARATSVRLRTTLAAVGVVAIALLVGAVALVLLSRGALVGGLEQAAEQRASALVAQAETGTLPTAQEQDDEPEDEVWQVRDDTGAVVAASQPLGRDLPTDDADAFALPGGEASYVVAVEEGEGYAASVGVSREEVGDSTAALVPLLGVGAPLLLLVVGLTTWAVVGRALRPVERIRAEVEQITGDRLERRVPEPATRDEVGRLARTMNGMLGRLQTARDQQRQFVGDASHELRSPLASLRQTAEVARAHPGALPEGELVDAVLEESARMQRLVEQLLLLTRADEGGLRVDADVDLDDLVLAEAARLRSKGLDVDASRVAPGRVRGDGLALAQVLRNLADNAARHATGAVRLSCRADGSVVEVRVEDDGSGVPEADRERVFDRFVRLDEARARDAGGSGLGLAIVRDAVRAHDGTVVVDRSDLGGAAFVVRLPS
ncbi:sensor histidine kinase [Nocardioides marmoraquaticus]